MYFLPQKWPKMRLLPTCRFISSRIAPNVNCGLAMPPINNPLSYEVRKVQNTSHLAMISVPKRFADSMRIQKGSLVKIQYDKAGSILIISKVHIDGDDGDDGYHVIAAVVLFKFPNENMTWP